jgi:hypothetical protein
MRGRNQGAVGLLRNPVHVTLNEVKGLLTLVESSSRRFFAALRMTKGGFFNGPAVTYLGKLRDILADSARRFDTPARES